TGGDGDGGKAGTVCALNSLVGTSPNEFVGFDGVVSLPNGNYLVDSCSWNSSRGAVTWAEDEGGVSGEISMLNSLIGTTVGDQVGCGGRIRVLPSSNYLVVSASWNQRRGAVTWGDGAMGIHGDISATNSLVGSNPDDQVGSTDITILTNGNYIVRSINWDQQRGAVTWGNGT